ncbi:unnamed protein product [Amoebophrya sp. A25]|nr:unnamed protein product [Amoebophrya sp. A25]|eukprot:GSA25T00013484001.1
MVPFVGRRAALLSVLGSWSQNSALLALAEDVKHVDATESQAQVGEVDDNVGSEGQKEAHVDDDDDDDLKDDVFDDPKEAVIALTDATFDKFIKENERVLVEFYAPWCGHCKSLAPEYEKAAQTMAAKGLKTKLVKIDGTEEKSQIQKHGVEGFPTMFYYTSGEKVEYTGPRKADGIVRWLESREKDAVEECSQQQIDEELAKDASVSPTKFVLVARVASKKSGKAVAVKKAMSKLVSAEKSEHVMACYVFLEKGADEKKNARIEITRKLAVVEDEKIATFTKGPWSAGKVETFIKESFFPTISKFDARFFDNDDYMESVGGSAAFIYQTEKDSLSEAELSDLKTAVKAHKNVKFAIKLGEKDAKFMSQILAFGGEKKLKYESNDKIKDFLAAWKNGKVKPSYKSAPVPAEPYDGNVRVLVGKNFEEVALSSKQDVFVEFYAPWCGHCKKLAPEWEKLAKTVRSWDPEGKKVIVAKMDSTENECAEAVQGFPTVVLYPAVKNSLKKRVLFSGAARTADALLEFLQEAATNMEDVDLSDQTVVDKSQFSMVDREMHKKKSKGSKKKKTEL